MTTPMARSGFTVPGLILSLFDRPHWLSPPCLARLHLLHKTCWVNSTLGSLTGQYNGLHVQYVLYRQGSCSFKTGVS